MQILQNCKFCKHRQFCKCAVFAKFANLTKFAIDYSDAVITGEGVSASVKNYIKDSEKLHLFPDHSDEKYPLQYSEFYDKMLETE